MTLLDAIEATGDEYDAEATAHEHDPLRNRIRRHEIEAVRASGLISDITSGAAIYPAETQELVRAWISTAFRFGMRVQRKLDHPDKPTSVIDTSYDGAPLRTEGVN
jgi:hypothetical protein